MSYNSNYPGATLEQLLDEYTAGNLGGEGGGAKVYDFDIETAGQLGAIEQEVYDAIVAADVVLIGGLPTAKTVNEAGSIELNAIMSGITEGTGAQIPLVGAIRCVVGADLTVTVTQGMGLAPNNVSELANDIGYITAAEAFKFYVTDFTYDQLYAEVTSGEPGQIECDTASLWDAVVAGKTIIVPVASDGSKLGDYIARAYVEDMLYVYIPDVDGYNIELTIYNRDDGYVDGQGVTIRESVHKDSLRTINGETLYNGGNLSIAEGTKVETAAWASEIQLVANTILDIQNTDAEGSIIAVTEATVLKTPTERNFKPFGVRLYIGDTVPQLTFSGLMSITTIWANGEPPLLEPNTLLEVVFTFTNTTGLWIALATWATYK